MRLEEHRTVAADPQAVWDAISDPHTMRRTWPSLTAFDPTDPEAMAGEGSQFELRMRVGSADLGGRVEVVEWDPPRELAWHSVTGIDHRVRWRVREAEDGTRVSVRLAYNAPGGVLATAADRLAAPVVAEELRAALANLAAELEGRPAPPRPRDPRLVPFTLARQALTTAVDGVHGAGVLAGAGLVQPIGPHGAVRAALGALRYGLTPAAALAANAGRFGGATAVIDDDGALSFHEVDRATSRLAVAWSAHVSAGDSVGIMCRNHRGFLLAAGAASKLGAHALLLNTAFAGPQLAEVVRREDPVALCFDEEFTDLLTEALEGRQAFVAEEIDETVAAVPEDADPPRPASAGRITILTSGTTGTPKGASRSGPGGPGPLVALLSKIPLRAREPTLIAAPLFHAWGFAHLGIALALGSTIVLQRRFDPERTLAGIAEHRCTACPVVPVMLQRILALPEEVRAAHDTSSLRVVPVSGSALSGDLARRFMDAFGDVLYNLYGSTEVAWATIATPRDLRRAPGTAGRPPRGTRLRIVDEDGVELPTGRTGRIVVGNEMLFEGYTGGGSKAVVDGLMATGDVGHLDHAGRLFVEGRDDDMLVSGGENVFPQEVEEVIQRLEGVADAACTGVDDEEFGQRLLAAVVLEDGASVTEDDVRAHVKAHLARFKVPRDVVLVDELPRTSTGKVLRRELAP